ncbi:hypothetical protein BAE44_0001086 [Dichanthelium oligosanthes]|uniref:SIAH-type domain-containing protein n=1 Tax=Dichanthelium oligosanthes TaxID=888268 RepID=A0A1E5WKC9_9POAL|nr:hypothetical protein BAE44_0001086 [Dichanthelium oligosanthes]
MCREPPETATRCHAMERVLNGLYTPCTFQQHGCTDMIPYAEKQAHEASCAHAPCHSPVAGCAGHAGGKSLRDHFMADHKDVMRARVWPRYLTLLRMPRTCEETRVACITCGTAELFLLVVGRGMPSGRTLSLLHLKDQFQVLDRDSVRSSSTRWRWSPGRPACSHCLARPRPWCG